MTLAPRTRSAHAPRRTLLASTLLVAIALAGCGGTPAASSAPSEGAPSPAASAAPSTAVSTEPSAAPSTAAPSSAAPAPSEAAVCLPPDVLAAVGELASGDLDPSVPRDQLADALEAIDPDAVDTSLFPYHDALVTMLRKEEVRDSLGAMAQDFLEIADGRIGAC
jgi:hypothetical protein